MQNTVTDHVLGSETLTNHSLRVDLPSVPIGDFAGHFSYTSLPVSFRLCVGRIVVAL